jgi:hypothetical protein
MPLLGENELCRQEIFLPGNSSLHIYERNGTTNISSVDTSLASILTENMKFEEPNQSEKHYNFPRKVPIDSPEQPMLQRESGDEKNVHTFSVSKANDYRASGTTSVDLNRGSCAGNASHELQTDFLTKSRPVAALNNNISKTYDTKQCLVVQGLPESPKPLPKDKTHDDLNSLQACIQPLLNPEENVEIYRSYRLGTVGDNSRPRPIKLILANDSQVDMLLARKHQLKNSSPHVFFQREYSPREREKHRQLLVQLHQRRIDGEKNLTIRNGEIISSTVTFLWNHPFSISK